MCSIVWCVHCTTPFCTLALDIWFSSVLQHINICMLLLLFYRETFQACVERDLSGAGAHKSMASPFQNPYKSYTTSSTAAGADPHTITAGTSTGTHSDGTSNASSDMDLLGLLRSFAEGDGIAERRSFINRLNNVADYSPATVAILQLCWDPTVTTKVSEFL